MQNSLDSLIGLAPVLILILFSLVLVGGGFALGAGVRSRRHRNKEEEYSQYLRDLQRQGEKLVKRLGRGCFGYRSMSTCLAGIEILGGAYFAITGSSVSTGTSDQMSGSHITVATLIGFAIIVTSAIQNRVHPYAKAVELRFRRWDLDYILDRSEKAKLDGIANSHIADVLIRAIRNATRPFNDKPEHPVSADPNMLHPKFVQRHSAPSSSARDAADDSGKNGGSDPGSLGDQPSL